MTFFRILCLGLVLGWVATVQAEDWKGQPETSKWTAGAVTGLGIIGNNSGFTFLGTVSKKIIKNGFVTGINDSVSIEGMLGPVAFIFPQGWIYSIHLRWDFIKDDQWTLFTVGGVGGNVVSSTTTLFLLAPRFGIGSFFKLQETVYLRADVSHDLLGLGVNFRF